MHDIALSMYDAGTVYGYQQTAYFGYALVADTAAHIFDIPVFILYDMFYKLEDEIIEAARLDGAGELQSFLHIGVPFAVKSIANYLKMMR